MLKRKFYITILLSMIVIIFFSMVAIKKTRLYEMDGNIAIPTSEVNYIIPYKPITVTREYSKRGIDFNYKLFGIFPIKKVSVMLVEDKEVFLGGEPIGINIGADGLIVSEKMSIVTQDGVKSPLDGIDILSGDIILQLNGKSVKNPQDIANVMKNNFDNPIQVVYRRGKDIKSTSIKPLFDIVSKEYKLGIWLKENIAGIGTLTYVNPENKRFGALGHPICDYETGADISTVTGNIFDGIIMGVTKGEKGKAGALNGTFYRDSKKRGSIDLNNNQGIFGKYNNVENLEKITVGSRYGVKPGKAHIYSTVNGNGVEKYEIQITKANVQQENETKGIVVKVTDKKLLDLTNGIVQGMSGSPIVQNGKIIGALTHVFINDPTRGYGTYLDFMMNYA